CRFQGWAVREVLRLQLRFLLAARLDGGERSLAGIQVGRHFSLHPDAGFNREGQKRGAQDNGDRAERGDQRADEQTRRSPQPGEGPDSTAGSTNSTVVSPPAGTLTPTFASPTRSCHAAIVRFPAGTFSITNAPSSCGVVNHG